MRGHDDGRQPRRGESSLLVNVAIIPPTTVGSAVCNFSGEIRPRGGEFVVDGLMRHPHLTLFLARVAKETPEEISDRLSQLLSSFRPFRAKHTGFFLTDDRFYEASYRRDESIFTLHKSVLGLIAPYRYSHDFPRREEFFGKYSQEQKKNVLKFGYDLAGDLFRPHITITRLKKGSVEPSLASDADLSFKVSQIGLFVADDFGAARSLVMKYRLFESGVWSDSSD
jgi:2'-5' RNA ligase